MSHGGPIHGWQQRVPPPCALSLAIQTDPLAQTIPFGCLLGKFAQHLLYAPDQRAEMFKTDPPGARLQSRL